MWILSATQKMQVIIVVYVIEILNDRDITSNRQKTKFPENL